MPEPKEPLTIVVPVGLIDVYKDNPEERTQIWYRIPLSEKMKIKSIYPGDSVIQCVMSKLWQELVLVCEKNNWKDYTDNEEFCEFVNNMTISKKVVKLAKKNGQ